MIFHVLGIGQRILEYLDVLTNLGKLETPLLFLQCFLLCSPESKRNTISISIINLLSKRVTAVQIPHETPGDVIIIDTRR